MVVRLAAYYHLSFARNANACLGEGRDRKCMNRMSAWNVGGINVEEKRREVMDVFRNDKFDSLAVTETKMKETVKMSCVF